MPADLPESNFHAALTVCAGRSARSQCTGRPIFRTRFSRRASTRSEPEPEKLKRMSAGKRGRPWKGPRVTQSVRFAPDQKMAYDAAAAELGLPLCDYVALVMAELFVASATSEAEREFFAPPAYIAEAMKAHKQKKAKPADLFAELEEDAA
jgi:hypothetical protein